MEDALQRTEAVDQNSKRCMSAAIPIYFAGHNIAKT